MRRYDRVAIKINYMTDYICSKPCKHLDNYISHAYKSYPNGYSFEGQQTLSQLLQALSMGVLRSDTFDLAQS